MKSFSMNKKNVVRPAAILIGSLIMGVFLSFGSHALAQALQYPNGVLFQSGITYIGNGSGNSGWRDNAFSCGAGRTLKGYHYDCNCSNNATWYVCVDSSLVTSGTVPPPAPDEPAPDFEPAAGDYSYYQNKGWIPGGSIQ
jgi:hypothetical protein